VATLAQLVLLDQQEELQGLEMAEAVVALHQLMPVALVALDISAAAAEAVVAPMQPAEHWLLAQAAQAAAAICSSFQSKENQ
jgi:hypothetical protein